MYKLEDIRAAACGRWQEILRSAGIPDQFLNSRKHCPCPACGGRDRYRFTNYKDSGGFICNQCKPEGGSGFDLLMLVYGYDFKSAVKVVAGALGMGDGYGEGMEYRPPIAAPNRKPEKDKFYKLKRTLDRCKDVRSTDAVAGYLRARGLDFEKIKGMTSVRFCPALQYWTPCEERGGAECLGEFPAMVATITDERGEIQGLHITYLSPPYEMPLGANGAHVPQFRKLKIKTRHGELLPAKKMQSRVSGCLKGCAIRLFLATDTLAVCEGIESALAAREMFGLPVWACCSAWGMQNLAIPARVKDLIILADHDESRTGIEAAEKLATRARSQGINARIWLPANQGMDALDELNERKRVTA